MKECIYCCECLHYSLCKRSKEFSEVTHMTCYHNYCFMTSSACCEFFESRRSIDDIYEEQKRTAPVCEPENDSDYGDILYDDDMPF